MNQNGVWKANMTNSGENEVHHQERRSAWCGVRGGQGQCWWWWRSAEWNWGVKIKAKVRRRGLRRTYPVEQPIHAKQHWKGREVTSLEWNWSAPIWGQGGDWGAPREKAGWSAEWNIEEPFETEERQRGLRSAKYSGGAPWGGGGGMKQPHHV